MMLVMSLAPILSPMRTSKVRSLRSQEGIENGAVLDFGNRALFNSRCESDVSTHVRWIRLTLVVRRNLTLPEVSLTDALSLIPVPERNLLTLAPSRNLEIHI